MPANSSLIMEFGGAGRFFEYSVAGFSLFIDRDLSQLASFRIRTSEIVLISSPISAAFDGVEPSYVGPGWIGNDWKTVRSIWSGSTVCVEVEGDVSAVVDLKSGRAALSRRSNSEIELELLLGPVLSLLLASRGVWLLHASAVTFGKRAFVFLGDSGAGKSTLARNVGLIPPFSPAGDDVLPVSLDGAGQVFALPHFPQLKLSPEQQPALTAPSRVRLDTIFVLGNGNDEVQSSVLSPASAALACMHHSVASKILSREYLLRHTRFFAKVAEAVPSFNLSYPKRMDVFPSVAEHIVQHF